MTAPGVLSLAVLAIRRRHAERAHQRPEHVADVREPGEPSLAVREIALGRGLVALVDEVDYGKVGQFSWGARRNGSRLLYALCTVKIGGQKHVRMHRLILDAPPHLEVDHANGNGLDNRRSNLRLCNRSQNIANSRQATGVSGYRGVHFRRGRWQARVMSRLAPRCIGTFDTAVEAARAYDAAATALWGEFARLNFPEPVRVAGLLDSSPREAAGAAGLCPVSADGPVRLSLHAPTMNRERDHV